MSINKTWNGVTYSIPNTRGESGWETTLSQYLQALADNAATTTFNKQAVRKATTTPVTVSASTDCTIIVDLTGPGASTVNLPAGADKQIFVIVDGKGDASTNNITIDANGSETIEGSLTKVIRLNRECLVLQYSSSAGDWKVIGGYVPNMVGGPASATDNAIARFDGATGKLVQNSDCTISDTGAVTLGPSSSDALNHRVNGHIGLGSTTTTNNAGYRWVGTENGGILCSLSAIDGFAAVAGGHLASGGWTAKAANIAIGGIRVGALTSGSSVVCDIYKLTESNADDYTFSSGTALTTYTSLLTVSASGAVTLGPASAIGTSTFPGASIVGKTDGTAIAVGYVGQILESTYTSDTAFNATNTWGNNASVVLTPGVWLLFGAFTAKLSTAAGFTAYHVDVSSTNGGTDGSPNNYAEALPPTSNTNTQTTIAGVYANVTTNTTYYLNYRGVYSSGSPKHVGRLRAVRIA